VSSHTKDSPSIEAFPSLSAAMATFYNGPKNIAEEEALLQGIRYAGTFATRRCVYV
jgi:hypothetical protein